MKIRDERGVVHACAKTVPQFSLCSARMGGIGTEFLINGKWVHETPVSCMWCITMMSTGRVEWQP